MSAARAPLTIIVIVMSDRQWLDVALDLDSVCGLDVAVDLESVRLLTGI